MKNRLKTLILMVLSLNGLSTYAFAGGERTIIGKAPDEKLIGMSPAHVLGKRQNPFQP